MPKLTSLRTKFLLFFAVFILLGLVATPFDSVSARLSALNLSSKKEKLSKKEKKSNKEKAGSEKSSKSSGSEKSRKSHIE
jgi:hypothetical protein